MAYTQKSAWPGLLGKGKQPAEGSKKDIRQKKRILGRAGEALTGDFTEADVTAVETAKTDYETAFQKRAELKDFSQRKRARLEKKTGIELSDIDVESSDVDLANKKITDIDQTKFKNVYSITGKYKGTKERRTQIGGGFSSGYVPPVTTTTEKEKEEDTDVSKRKFKDKRSSSSSRYSTRVAPLRSFLTGKLIMKKAKGKSIFRKGGTFQQGGKD